MKFTRRQFAGSFVAAAPFIGAGISRAQSVAGTAHGLVPDAPTDQSAALQAAINATALANQVLDLPAGTYIASNIRLPSFARIRGAGRATKLVLGGAGQLLLGEGTTDVSLSDIAIEGGTSSTTDQPMVQLTACEQVAISRCHFGGIVGTALRADLSQCIVADCTYDRVGETAIHFQNARDSRITGNSIKTAGNGGIRVWRDGSGYDGTLIDHNRISGIGSTSGNGQNGNGINVFQADHVTVSDNVVSDCDFSAIRANSTQNTIIANNNCRDLREVAIFSEFGFSGSIIANNIIDKAATGISIANLDHNGHLAVCTGNIIRNITPLSPTNPDTLPVGIFAEAEAAISNNVIEDLPGVGIAAGWGPYLRNVLVNDNIVRRARIGVGVSVAEGAGACSITNNLLASCSDAAIAGLAWTEIAETDLIANSNRYAHLTLSGNQVSG